MIRALVLCLGLLLGLALAVVSSLRQEHLSALMGDSLPGWVQALAGDASVLRGSAAPLGGRLALDVAWRLSRIGSAGPVWRLQVSGPGVQLAGALAFDADGAAHLRDIGGTVDLAALASWEHRPEFDARLQITRASATLSPHAATLSTFQAEGVAEDVVLGQSALGRAHAVATLAADGRWNLRLSLAAGQAEAEMSGDALGGILRLHVDADHEALLPTGWGTPQPHGDSRLMVSHLLPLRPPTDDMLRP